MMEWVIETQDLQKTFGKQSAVDGLNLQVPSGSIYGFLRKNGAGKTTTIELLLNIVKPSGGHASVFGIPVTDIARSTQVRQRIGFVSEDKGLYPYMTVEQIIRFTRPFFPGWRDDLERKYLELFNLPLKKKVGDLSKGTGSKLMLLLAIARGADLLISMNPRMDWILPQLKKFFGNWFPSQRRMEQRFSFRLINCRKWSRSRSTFALSITGRRLSPALWMI